MPPGHEREINIWGIFINTGQINVNKQQPYRIRRPLHKGWHRADSRMLSMAHGGACARGWIGRIFRCIRFSIIAVPRHAGILHSFTRES
jgi:hypothetical protein